MVLVVICARSLCPMRVTRHVLNIVDIPHRDDDDVDDRHVGEPMQRVLGRSAGSETARVP